MGYLPGFVRRASLTLRLGNCLASFGEAQMANALKKVSFYFFWSLSLEISVFPHYFLASPSFPHLARFLTLKKVKYFPDKMPQSQISLLPFSRLPYGFLN